MNELTEKHEVFFDHLMHGIAVNKFSKENGCLRLNHNEWVMGIEHEGRIYVGWTSTCPYRDQPERITIELHDEKSFDPQDKINIINFAFEVLQKRSGSKLGQGPTDFVVVDPSQLDEV